MFIRLRDLLASQSAAGDQLKRRLRSVSQPGPLPHLHLPTILPDAALHSWPVPDPGLWRPAVVYTRPREPSDDLESFQRLSSTDQRLLGDY